MSAAAVLSRATGRLCSRNSLAAFRAQELSWYAVNNSPEVLYEFFDHVLTIVQQEDAGACSPRQILCLQMSVARLLHQVW